MGDKITAPFSKKQRKALNRYQATGHFHPFTCGMCGRELAAKKRGWACPSGDGYKQGWAHAWMLDPEFLPLYPKNS